MREGWGDGDREGRAYLHVLLVDRRENGDMEA